MIKIKTLRYDDVDDYQIRIYFHGDLCTAALDIWAQSGLFTDFANDLIEFPFGKKKTIGFEYGQDNLKWAYFLSIDVDVYDPSGRIVIKTLVDNKGDDNHHYRCQFPIFTDIPTINELGRQLIKWAPVENETWSFTMTK